MMWDAMADGDESKNQGGGNKGLNTHLMVVLRPRTSFAAPRNRDDVRETHTGYAIPSPKTPQATGYYDIAKGTVRRKL
jgi:hypothetical protein